MKSQSVAICLALLLLVPGAVEANIWQPKTSITTAVHEGGGITYASFPRSRTTDSLYAQCGACPGALNKFYYFDISDNGGVGFWRRLQETPFEFNTFNGGAICYAPNGQWDYNRIYSLQGSQQLCYFVHDAGNEGFGTWTWTGTAGNLPYHYAGCALTYGGPSPSGWDAYVYAFRGGDYPNSKEFHRYQYSTVPAKSDLANPWTQMVDFHTTNVRHGALTYNTKYHSAGSKIYGLGCGGDAKFKGYNPAANTWAELTRPWSSIGPGVALEAKTVMFANSDSTDSIYALRGYTSDANSRDFRLWYDISTTPTWRLRAALPWTPGARAGADLAFCPKNRRFYALRGGGTRDFAEYQPYGDVEGGGGQGETGSAQTPALIRVIPVGNRQFRLVCAQTAGQAALFQVFDAAGREVWQRQTTAGETVWSADESGARSGAYFVTAAWTRGRSTGRLVVAH